MTPTASAATRAARSRRRGRPTAAAGSPTRDSLPKVLFPTSRLSVLALPAALPDATGRTTANVSTPAALLGQGALARFIAAGHLTVYQRHTRLLPAGRRQGLLAAAGCELAGLLHMASDPGGMHLAARPHPDLGPGLGDPAAAARAAGVQISPLPTCHRGPPIAQGFRLGYAGNPKRQDRPGHSTASRHPGGQSRPTRVQGDPGPGLPYAQGTP